MVTAVRESMKFILTFFVFIYLGSDDGVYARARVCM